MSYQPRYRWRRTGLDKNDPPADPDWLGFDGVGCIGRVRKETAGPDAGQWHWAGSLPRTFQGTPPMPNSGYVSTARLATRLVEEYWDRALAK